MDNLLTQNCHCFNAVVSNLSNTLILGSMPSTRSLAANQYYAHPQNRFWPLMTKILAPNTPPCTYGERLAMLQASNIALWDVIANCHRQGSLDSAITKDVPNDFTSFFTQYPQIKKVCFNGGKSFLSFKKHHKHLLTYSDITYIALPSTSPANATWRMEMLEQVWSQALLAPN